MVIEDIKTVIDLNFPLYYGQPTTQVTGGETNVYRKDDIFSTNELYADA